MKPIWISPISIETINSFANHSLSEFLGIEYTKIGEDFLEATMTVNERAMQPMGSLHGGVSCCLAETVGSVAANFCVDQSEKYCLGLELNINHIKAIRSGPIIASARPLHLGQSTQIWDIQIKNEAGALVAVSRLTMAVLKKKIGLTKQSPMSPKN